MSKVDISVVIVTYNVKELLKDCLDSLENSARFGNINLETFVVDNGDDGTDEMVKSGYDWVKYVPNPANDGYSKANNLALGRTKGKYILVLNPDTKLQKKTLKTMLQFMEDNPEVGVSTARVELPDGNLDGACHRGFPTPWNSFSRYTKLSKKFPTSRIFNGYNMGYLDVSKVHEVDSVAGAFMFIRKSAILGDGFHPKVGFLDEDYWAFGEDIDWCYRFKRAGWKIMYVPTTRIIHYKGASGGTQISSQNVTKATVETKKKWINAFYDAMPIFYRKHYNDKYPFFVKWMVLLGVELKRRIALKKLLT